MTAIPRLQPIEWFVVERDECRQSRARLLSILEAQESVLAVEELSYLADYRDLVHAAAILLCEAIIACERVVTHDGAIAAHHAVYQARVAVSAVDALESDVAHRTALLACRRVAL